MDNEDDRATDRPTAPASVSTHYAVIGWQAGNYLPGLHANPTSVASYLLIHNPVELGLFVGNVVSQDGSLPETSIIVNRAATAAWHRANYLARPLHLDPRAASAWDLPPERLPCTGVGIGIELNPFRPNEQAEFWCSFRSDLERLTFRLRFKRGIQERHTVDRVGCAWLAEAMRLFPAVPPLDVPPPEVALIHLRQASFQDKS
jgi:hypothetical protein